MPKKIAEWRDTRFEHYRSRSCLPVRPQVLRCANDRCAVTTLHPAVRSNRCCVARLLVCSSQLPIPALALPEVQLHPVDQDAKRAHPQAASCRPKPLCQIRRVMQRQLLLHELHIRQSHRCCLLLLIFQVRPANRPLQAVAGPRAATRCK